jgi:hypothetical protein
VRIVSPTRSVQTAVPATAVLLAALSLSACTAASPSIPADQPALPPAQIHDDWPGCYALGAFGAAEEQQPDFGQGSIPDDFTPVAAVRCAFGETEQRYRDGLERRATDPEQLDELMGYLDRPSQRAPVPDDQVCVSMAWFPPWLYLLDGDGRWLRPQVPVDACGFALDLFTSDHRLPYDTMTFTDTVVCQRSGKSICRPV